MSSQPLDIWLTILDNVPRNNQLRIAQVSTQFCDVARKVIYRYVDLLSISRTVQAALALLARDNSVAHRPTTSHHQLHPCWSREGSHLVQHRCAPWDGEFLEARMDWNALLYEGRPSQLGMYEFQQLQGGAILGCLSSWDGRESFCSL